MKKIIALGFFVIIVILFVSTTFHIFFPVTVVASAAQQVPPAGKVLLWYWLAGLNAPSDEMLVQNADQFYFSYEQSAVDAWLSQYIGTETDPDLVWVNNLMFFPMDNPVYTISPVYDFEWTPIKEETDRPQFVCAPLVVGGTTYQTDYYGSDNGPGVWEHTGMDFGTNHQVGLPVITPMDGKVVYAGPYQGWGYTVIIQNGDYQVWLTHAIDFNVQAGDTVQAGDVVMFSGGAVGSAGAGNSSGPHLHFEVRHCEEDADGKVTCEIVNPNATLLPGQEEVCFWSSQVSNPEMNWGPYTNIGD